EDGVHGRRGLEVVVGDEDLGAAAELREAVLGGLGTFDFDIHGVGAVTHGQIQDGELLFDAAVEFPVVLVAPAGGQDRTFGELIEEGGDGWGTATGVIEEVEAEFEEGLSRRGLAPSVVQQSLDVWQAQRNANPRKKPGLRHSRKVQNNTG